MLGSQDIKKLEIDIQNNPEVTQETTPIETPEVAQPLAVVPRDIVLNKLAEMFGILSSEVGKYNADLDRIVEYAKEKGATNLDEIMFRVREISDSLANNMNEKKLKTVSRYLFLLGDRAKIEQDIERMKS
jgi:hypothetical protein